MKHSKKFSLLFVLILSFVAIPHVFAFPDLSIGAPEEDTTTTDKADEEEKEKIEDLKDEIEKYEKRLSDLNNKEKTLANQIASIADQVKLTQLQIENTTAQILQKERQIERLGGDIEETKSRITRLKDSMAFQLKVLNSRMRERYKANDDNPLSVLFGSSFASAMVQKSTYLKTMEYKDKEIIAEMKRIRENFVLQKNLLVEKKAQAEELKKDIESEKAKQVAYNITLEDQLTEQQNLLKLTQNDEAKYQKLLAEAQRELDQITNAASVLKNTEPREVKRGELIGVQGNTGYSFGDHLHFGVYKYDSFEDIDGWNWYYSNYVDPKKVLKEKNVYWNTGCESADTRSVGDGDWTWPLASPTISQAFGHTCYSNSYYGGKPHPAYDMYGPNGSYVYAIEEGDAYFCRNCLGDGGNGVFIFHPKGYMSLYWHLK